MTVSELAAKLMAMEAEGHGQLLVKTEGCDCTGTAIGVEVMGGEAMITREDGWNTSRGQRQAGVPSDDDLLAGDG